MKKLLVLEAFRYPLYDRIENITFFNQNEDIKLVDLFSGGNPCRVDIDYSYMSEIIKLSIKNKNVLFIVTSYSYEFYRSYALNGRFYSTRGNIVFDEFDFDKLWN